MYSIFQMADRFRRTETCNNSRDSNRASGAASTSLYFCLGHRRARVILLLVQYLHSRIHLDPEYITDGIVLF